ncbi:MAG: hypothetical protein ACYC3N_03340 [Halothiobacillus sp.]
MNKIRSFFTSKLMSDSIPRAARTLATSGLLLGGLLLGGLGLSGCAVAYPQGYSSYSEGYSNSPNVIVGIDYGRHRPPPPPYEAIGIAPFYGAIWMPGQWVWQDRWIWHRGSWGGWPAQPRYYPGPGWVPGYGPVYRYPGYWRGDDRWRHEWHGDDDRRGDGHWRHRDDDD